MNRHSDWERIEEIIDRRGLFGFLEITAEICNEKAEHVFSNWQDKELANQWQNAASVINKTAHKLHGTRVS